jgi:hypothetical protein
VRRAYAQTGQANMRIIIAIPACMDTWDDPGRARLGFKRCSAITKARSQPTWHISHGDLSSTFIADPNQVRLRLRISGRFTKNYPLAICRGEIHSPYFWAAAGRRAGAAHSIHHPDSLHERAPLAPNRGERGSLAVELAEIYSKQAHLTSAWAKILAYETPAQPREVAHTRPRNLSRRMSADQVHAIIERYEAGQDSRQLATQFNISPPSVLRLLHQGGVHVRGH